MDNETIYTEQELEKRREAVLQYLAARHIARLKAAIKERETAQQ